MGMSTESAPAWITTGEVARALGLSEPHVRRLADRGVLHAVRAGRGLRLFNPVEVRAVAESRRHLAEEITAAEREAGK